MKFFSLILLLFSTVTSHGDSTKIDCPGVVVDGKTYIGVKNDLEPLSEFFQDPYTSFCEFTELDVNLRNPTVKIASTYSCDLGILGTCQGYLVNSNYVFWDQEGGRQFLDPPQHCHLITSCQQIQDVCDTTSDLSCDKGEYVCRPLHDKSSWCQGKVVSPTDPEPCPEKVTDCHELKLNCDCTLNGGANFWCYDDHRECRGRVVAPLPETENPKPTYIPPEQRADGTVLTLANPPEMDTMASPKKSKHGNRSLIASGLLVGVAMVAYRRLRSNYMPSSSDGNGYASKEYEMGAYENSLPSDDF